MGGLGWLLGSGGYRAFIRADFWPLLAGAIVLLTLLMWGSLTPSSAECHGHHHEGQTTLRRWAGVLLLLLPVWFAACGLSERSLNADAFSQRWVNQPVSEAVAHEATDSADGLTQVQESEASESKAQDLPETVQQAPNATADPGEQMVEDEAAQAPAIVPASSALPNPIPVNLLDVKYRSQQLDGMRISVIGRVARPEDTPEGTFILFRFLISCCAADAQPIAVLVRVPDTSLPEVDKWVEIRGRTTIETIRGIKALILEADTVKEIPAPSSPYIDMS